MAAHTTALYKLIILYMLNRVDFPLTKAQICEFILGKEYTNFLTLQECFAELIDEEMIVAKSMRNRTHLTITEEGKNTLHYFENQINRTIKDEIDEYFSSNSMELRNEVSILADYYKATSGEYEAHLRAIDKGITLVDITMSVTDEETASSICQNWEKKNQIVYQNLIKELF